MDIVFGGNVGLGGSGWDKRGLGVGVLVGAWTETATPEVNGTSAKQPRLKCVTQLWIQNMHFASVPCPT